MHRKLLALITWMALFFPVTVYAQTPTPPPPAYQVCLDGKLGSCVERLFQEYGLWVVIFAVLVVFVIIPAAQGKMQERVKGLLSWNPFARAVGLRHYLKAFVAENRIFGFRGMVDYALKPIDLTNAYIQLDLNFSKLVEKEAGRKDGDSVSEKAMLQQGEKTIFNLSEILGAGYKKIVIVGDAGSGKSALMQWTGMTVAQGRLFQRLSGDQTALLKAIRSNRLFRPYVPVLVPLRKYYAHCRSNKVSIDANSLYSFICEYSRREYRKEDLPDDLFRHLLGGGCLLMFDGMDEIEFADRSSVRAAVEGVVADDRNSGRNIYLVTTRPSAADITSQLMDFETVTVLPVTPEKRANIIN